MLKKSKKLFAYEGKTINSKELEEDLRKAEDLIENLKLKVDPNKEKEQRRKHVRNLIVDTLIYLIILAFAFGGYFLGFGSGLDAAEKIYNYSVSVGYLIPHE